MAKTDSSSAERVATMLCEKLQNPAFFEWYCKISYQLSEAQISNLLEIALTKNSPSKYFSTAAKREIDKK